MALIYNWESFIRIHGGEPGARDVFEKAMDELLRAENPDKEVHLVKASPGDGGIDVYVQQNGGIDIYQCKFFMGKLNGTQWRQVKDSFSKAMEPKGIHVISWFLCMPREMQTDDIRKWNEFKNERQDYNVDIRFIDGNEIIHRMETCDTNRGTELIARYFTESHNTNHMLTQLLPGAIYAGNFQLNLGGGNIQINNSEIGQYEEKNKNKGHIENEVIGREW